MSNLGGALNYSTQLVFFYPDSMVVFPRIPYHRCLSAPFRWLEKTIVTDGRNCRCSSLSFCVVSASSSKLWWVYSWINLFSFQKIINNNQRCWKQYLSIYSLYYWWNERESDSRVYDLYPSIIIDVQGQCFSHTHTNYYIYARFLIRIVNASH
jgi:hypothetical protein